MKPYKVKTDDLSRCVMLYKKRKGYAFDDREWDKLNWSWAKKVCKLLLSYFKSVEVFEKCLNELSSKFEDAGLQWTIAAIQRNASDWYKTYKEADDIRYNTNLISEAIKNCVNKCDNGYLHIEDEHGNQVSKMCSCLSNVQKSLRK